MEILKAEIAFATTTKGKLEVKGFANKTLSGLESLQINKMPYRGSLKSKRACWRKKWNELC
jgi:hypothetical protein